MKIRRIHFLDANTIWHRRLAEALADLVPVRIISPRTGLLPRSRSQPGGHPGIAEVEISLPRGWASFAAALWQPLVARHLHPASVDQGDFAILTSPAYLPIARKLGGQLPFAYYCADDYRSYSGWHGNIAQREREICRRADVSVFVSEALRKRAIVDYELDPARTFVSPNATEPRFSPSTLSVPHDSNRPPGPILGILGSVTERLDLDLIRRASQLSSFGTLMLVGEISSRIVDRAPWLTTSSKIVTTGPVPHADMHLYALQLDAALIPYAHTPLNHFCSPMRLYDHLASGIPIFATDACDQINSARCPAITVGTPEKIVAGLSGTSCSRPPQPCRSDIYWSDRATRLLDALREI